MQRVSHRDRAFRFLRRADQRATLAALGALLLMLTGTAAVKAEDESDAGPALSLAADRALQLDGSNGYVNLGNAPELNPTEAITLEVWFKITAPLEGGRHTVLRRSHDSSGEFSGRHSGNNCYHIEVRGERVRIRFKTLSVYGDGTIEHDTWTHLALTYDTHENRVRMYQDGEQVLDMEHTEPLATADENTVVGAREYGGRTSGNTDGFVRDVRIWNRARTQEQVQADMDRELSGDEDGLVGYWRLNEGDGQVAFDGSSNRNDGEIVGGEWVEQQTIAPRVVAENQHATFRVQVRDEDGRPNTAGAFENVVSATGGTLEPETISIPEGRSEAHFKWIPGPSGRYELKAEHPDLQPLTHEMHVGIFDALGNESQTVRLHALAALDRLGPDAFLDKLDDEKYPRAFSLLIELLQAEDSDAWHAAFDASARMLEALYDRADEPSIELIRHAQTEAPSARIRVKATQMLASLHDNAAVADDLRKALNDDDWRVRTAARQALQELDLYEPTEVADAETDWPMWRYDAARGAASPHRLADELHLHWVRELPEPRRAWPEQQDDRPHHRRPESPPEARDQLAFDRSYEPVAAEGRVFVPSMVTDSVTAYDADTGEQQWRHYASGPVRVPPAVHDGRVYAASDDGSLYCLDAETGELVWQFDAAPTTRQVLGNERLVSMWSLRGGPAIKDGIVYFTAGVWPHEGVFMHAVEADTGDLIWRNSGTGSITHVDEGFDALAPQGSLVVSGDTLVLPGGKTGPAVADRHSGEFLLGHHWGKTTGWGGYGVFAQEQVYGDHGVLYSMETGREVESLGIHVVADDALFGVREDRPFAYFPAAREEENLHEWDAVEDADLYRLHAKAGQVLYGSGRGGEIYAIDVPEMQVAWSAQIEGEVFRMFVARGRLFVVSEEGRLYTFGPEPRDAVVHAHEPKPLTPGDDAWAERAGQLLDYTGETEGYALMFGVGSGRLLEELLIQSDLHIIAFDPDPEKVQRLRQRFTDADLYGERVAVREGDAMSHQLPPYIASLVVSESPADAGLAADERFAEALFHPLRPYGGTIYLPLAGEEQSDFAEAVERAELENAAVHAGEAYLAVSRPGALLGSDTWTHEYSDSGNTTYSHDSRVRGPLGVAWFGGPSNERVLPRHGNGPVPQVVGGRLIIMGPHHLTARCVYTGREIWQVELPDVGRFFTNTSHQPGSIFIGSPYVSTEDSVYVMHEDRCLRLDLETGEQLAAFEMPGHSELRAAVPPDAEVRDESYAAKVTEGEQQRWGYVSVSGDYLVVGAYPHTFDDRLPGNRETWNLTSSEYLVVMDRRSGELEWARQAAYGFRHNAIASDAGQAFVIDNLSDQILQQLSRRGIDPGIRPQIHAFSLDDGRELWSYDDHVFGTRLSYSAEHDVLVQGGAKGRRHNILPDEPNAELLGIRGSDGTELWRRESTHTGAVALHEGLQRIVASENERALDMLTGENHAIDHPISRIPERWRWTRGGARCGTQNVSKYLITFRASTAAYHDMYNDSGTVHIPGFRAGCTNNLVAADGVLNAPDYTRTCTCPYPHQTSLGMVHMPEATMWAYNSFSDPDPGTIRHIGINFGAPGARTEDDGAMWVNYPDVSRVATPRVPLELDADDAEWFRGHAMEIEQTGDGLGWVAATGGRNVRGIRLDGLYNDTASGGSSYTVRLHFAEPDRIEAGERVFDVKVQGETVVEGLDLVGETGGARRVFVAEVANVSLGEGNAVEVELIGRDGSRGPVISGIEAEIEP